MYRFLSEYSSFNEYKIRFLKLTCILSFVTELFYLHRYIFVHDQIFYVKLIAPFILLTGVCGYFIFCKSAYETGAKLLLTSCVIPLVILIGSVGGFEAPGLQWLSLIPMMFGLFFGRKGLLPGVIVLFLTCSIYYFVDLPNFILNPDHYIKEKITNFVLYSIFLLIFFFGYIGIMENYEKDLNEKNEQVKNLLRVVIHDLSNPIQILKIIIDQNKKHLEPRVLEKADRSLQNIVTIINDVRQLQAFADNKITLKKLNVSPNELTNDIEILFKSQLLNKNISLIFSDSLPPNFEVETDPTIFKNQVLNNFISNGIKFSPENSTIEVKTSRENDKLVIRVTDSGPGIDLEVIDDLFSSTKKTSNLGTIGEKGTGYGLPIAKFFADRLDIKLEVLTPKNSPMEKGTCFKMTFN